MDDIKQSSLGDCYFLTEISAPSLVKEKFRTVKYNPLGFFYSSMKNSRLFFLNVFFLIIPIIALI